jgi:hypothetical protein
MNEDSTRISSSRRIPRILIADNDFSAFEPLIDTGNSKGNEAFEKARVSMEKTVSAFEVTIQRIEESIKCLADLAQMTARQAQKLAFERLDGLSPT